MKSLAFLILIKCISEIISSYNNYTTSNPYLIDYNSNSTLSKSNYLEDIRLLQEESVSLITDEFQPIRVFIDNTTILGQAQYISQSYIDKVLEILKKAVTALKYLLRVKRLKQNLSIEYCHNEILIHSNIVGIGLETDLIIFPFINLNKTSNSLVYAQYCNQGVDGRPTAGYMSINNDYDFTKINYIDYYTTTMLHGLLHIVGFDEDLFPFYVEKGTNTPKGLNKVVVDDVTDTEYQLLFVEETTANTAKIYFNCTSFRGIPLRSKKYNKISSTHWNARYMLGDIMVETVYGDRVLSEMTLALLESTGWYEVNYFTGGLFRFGKNAGCNFVENKCVKNSYTDFSNEFCTSVGLFMCSAGRLSRGRCFIDKELKNKLPAQDQLFNSPNIGGLETANYCPVSMPTLSTKDYYFSDSCSLGDNVFSSSFGEVISESSACFLTNLFLKNDPGIQTYSKQMTAVCYEYICNNNDKTYKIKIKENIYSCPSEGGVITTTSTEGQLQCPRYSLICTKSVVCSTMLDCIMKGSLNIVTFDKVDNIATQNLNGDKLDPTLLENDMYKHDGEAQFFIGLINKQNTSNSIQAMCYFIAVITMIIIN